MPDTGEDGKAGCSSDAGGGVDGAANEAARPSPLLASCLGPNKSPKKEVEPLELVLEKNLKPPPGNPRAAGPVALMSADAVAVAVAGAGAGVGAGAGAGAGTDAKMVSGRGAASGVGADGAATGVPPSSLSRLALAGQEVRLSWQVTEE